MTKTLEANNNKVTKTFKNIIPLTFGEEIGNACLLYTSPSPRD